MAKFIFCMVMISALLLTDAVSLSAEVLTINILNCPKNVKAGQNLGSSFKLAIRNNGDIALKDAIVEIVIKNDAKCPARLRHPFYSTNYFDGVLLRGGRESVSLDPKHKVILSPHGLNTIPTDIPVGRTYFLCAFIIANNKVPDIGEGTNCHCCPVKVIGTEVKPVITGYAEPCISRNGNVTILGRNFGSSTGKVVYLSGNTNNIELPVISWNDSLIIARVPDNQRIQDEQKYFIGIRKADIAGWVSNTGAYVSVCKDKKAMPQPRSAPPTIPPFFY
jgi:hypothetical protein